MKSMSMTGLILLTGALMVLPGCAARDALAPTSGRSVKLVFKQQAKKRSTMRIAPLTAFESELILGKYEQQQGGKKKARSKSRSSVGVGTATAKPRLRRID